MEHRETMAKTDFQHRGLRRPCAGLDIKRKNSAIRTTSFTAFASETWGDAIVTSDYEQSLLPEVTRNAPFDGDGEGIVLRPESDDGVADGNLGDAVCRGGCQWANRLTVPLRCNLFRGHYRLCKM